MISATGEVYKSYNRRPVQTSAVHRNEVHVNILNIQLIWTNCVQDDR